MVAARQIPVLVAIGPAMQTAADAAAAAGVQVHRFPDTATACRGIRSLLQPNDAILLKGSHGMALETVLAALMPAGAPALEPQPA